MELIAKTTATALNRRSLPRITIFIIGGMTRRTRQRRPKVSAASTALAARMLQRTTRTRQRRTAYGTKAPQVYLMAALAPMRELLATLAQLAQVASRQAEVSASEINSSSIAVGSRSDNRLQQRSERLREEYCPLAQLTRPRRVRSVSDKVQIVSSSSSHFHGRSPSRYCSMICRCGDSLI